MFSADPARLDERSPTPWHALLLSLLGHILVLCLPAAEPPQQQAPQVVQATLRPARAAENAPPSAEPSRKVPEQRPRATRPKRKTPAPPPILHAPGRQGTWSVAERAQMDNFLNELANEARQRKPPTLEQRALAMARGYGQELAREEQQDSALLELRPNAAPPNPFSLELYLEALVKRLNRSAAYVRNDRRSQGVRKAEVRVRLNPDGSLKSFSVVNQGDQDDEIAFIRAVVEKAVPFSPFPEDIDKAAKSLTLSICIDPRMFGDGGFGFRKMPNGRGC